MRKDQNHEKLIIKSKVRTGFKGFIIDMHNLIEIYKEYIINKQLMTSIHVHWLGQDSLEIFFGKCRSLNGFNDNPTSQQFMAAFRKLLAFDAILCSRYSNCTEHTVPSQPFANILYVSSRPSIAEEVSNGSVSSSELETLYQRLSEIEAMERSSLLDNLQDFTVAYIASIIEQRISKKDLYCRFCENIFSENEKMQNAFTGSKIPQKPCSSTFQICKEADRFLKLQVLRGEFRFDVFYEAICNRMDVERLYTKTDFSHNFEHKLYLIRSIVNVYIQIKGTFLARSAVASNQKPSDPHRNQLRKLIHNHGR